MKIVVIGRGNVGGGLADRWERAGHEVVRIGRDGGDATGADAALLAVPSGAIEDSLRGVTGLDGVPVVDATNHFQGERPPFESLAHQVKAITGGPVAKAFNLNYARLYDRIDDERARPSVLYCADDEARDVTEQLARDAGYEPVSAGDLSAARMLEDHLGLMGAVNRAGLGLFFYRMAPPGRF